MKQRTLPKLLASLLLLSGCVDDDAPPPPAPASYQTEGWGCRDCTFKNSPFLGFSALEGRSIEHVGYGAKADPREPRILGAVGPSGRSAPVLFDEGGIGVQLDRGRVLREGDLVGWALELQVPERGVVMLEIDAFDNVPDWTREQHLVPTYGLSYLHPTGVRTSICPGLEAGETTAVFLHGERYDLGLPEAVVEVPNGGTIACRGHAMAKMKLLGYEPGSPYDTTSAEERAATLRMITADYCGTGIPHTEIGTAIDWVDRRGFVPFDGEKTSRVVEARWTAKGATCLDEPRIAGLKAACELPRCEGLFDGEVGDATWISLLP